MDFYMKLPRSKEEIPRKDRLKKAVENRERV
jgi:hypothetical protein